MFIEQKRKVKIMLPLNHTKGWTQLRHVSYIFVTKITIHPIRVEKVTLTSYESIRIRRVKYLRLANVVIFYIW